MSPRKRIDLDQFVGELESRSATAKAARDQAAEAREKRASEAREKAANDQREAAILRKMSYKEVWEWRQRIEEREKRLKDREIFLQQASKKNAITDTLEKTILSLFHRPLRLDGHVQRLWDRPDVNLRRKGNEIHISMGATYALALGSLEKSRFVTSRILARAVANSESRSGVGIEIQNRYTPRVDDYPPCHLYIDFNDTASQSQIDELERNGFGLVGIDTLRNKPDKCICNNAADAFEYISDSLMRYLTSPLGAHYANSFVGNSGGS